MKALPVEEQAARLKTVFERIHQEQMLGLPLLNEALSVETLGFQLYQGRVVGVLVTPWMLSLVLLPGDNDDWETMALGDKQSQTFPSGSYRCMVNRIEGIGVCQMYSVHSPMRDFASQAEALVEAAGFLEKLLTPTQADPDAPEVVDETLLGRILRGEAVPAVDAAVSEMQTGQTATKSN